MIKIDVLYDGKFIKNFKVTGHANYDEYGKDIVCSSVSSIVIVSSNLALRYNDKAIKFVQKEGLIDVNVLVFNDTINTVFINMIESLKELEKDYKKNIKINIKGGALNA